MVSMLGGVRLIANTPSNKYGKGRWVHCIYGGRAARTRQTFIENMVQVGRGMDYSKLENFKFCVLLIAKCLSTTFALCEVHYGNGKKH